MPRPGLTVICDFDGTVTTADIGYALCERFAPGVLARADERWRAGEVSFHDAYRIACLELTAPHEEMVGHALEVAVVRDGFLELVETCVSGGVELIVASAGIDLYVEPVLRRHLGALRDRIEVRANAGTITSGGVAVTFPHLHPDCAACGNCKGLHARRAQAEGRVVIGVGDSHTDACLAGQVQHLFARTWLAEHCRGRGIMHHAYDDFHPVVRLVRDIR